MEVRAHMPVNAFPAFSNHTFIGSSTAAHLVQHTAKVTALSSRAGLSLQQRFLRDL